MPSVEGAKGWVLELSLGKHDYRPNATRFSDLPFVESVASGFKDEDASAKKQC